MNNISMERFERVLESVKKASTYLGVEKNSVHKDHEKIDASIALAFPDLYEIGMSHLGLKILYNVINGQPDLVAERVFTPGEDFATAIKSENMPFMSLETRRPLKDFDILGFTIPYELSYTNMLWMLDLAGIPLKTLDRDDATTFVIGGGAGVYNVEPVAEFFDCFVLGDGEETVLTVMRLIASQKGKPRNETLEKLSHVPGVYVPSLFDVSYDTEGKIEKVSPKLAEYKKATRVFLPTLSESPFPYEIVIPFGKPVQDRLNVEIDRGCTQGCRFCQAGTTYRPVRERTPAEIMAIIEKALGLTGYDSVTVTSLSAGDYSKIEPLLSTLMNRYEGEKVGVSLPSLRSDTVTSNIIREVGRVKKTGFTITSEAGTQRLRDVLNKNVTDEAIIRVATNLLESGWRSLKLYFMIGLPTETDEDVEAIFKLSDKLAQLTVNKKRFQTITVSVSNFVPKPHTAFQWVGQDSIESLIRKKERLFDLIRRNKRLRLKWNNAKMSFLEAVFSRGDRKLSRVVERAYRTGCKMDAWTEFFSYDGWMAAFKEEGIEPEFYANRDFDLDETLPWDHIDTGLTKKFFLREWKHAQKAEMTGDCKTANCEGCGLDPNTCFKPYDWPEVEKPEADQSTQKNRFKYRLTYTKTGLVKFLAHLETVSVLTRAIRIAKLPVMYSEGYSPHPRISFGPALPVGVESYAEAMDIEFSSKFAAEPLLQILNSVTPRGFNFTDCEEISIGTKSISSLIKGAEYKIAFRNAMPEEQINTAIKSFMESESRIIVREGPSGKSIDTRPMIKEITTISNLAGIRFKTVNSPTGSVRPNEVVKALFADNTPEIASITKLANILNMQDKIAI
ncbi:FIG092679: Fe-S oxidoreductase [hydrothermal vent metagenome]|uniref:FIG092679: Fe-S oxidoreductase n=1 Tax=hydrothermal vent metagenome TaxID=652676 RepID=A0A3B1CB31_9ZZZZ